MDIFYDIVNFLLLKSQMKNIKETSLKVTEKFAFQI